MRSHFALFTVPRALLHADLDSRRQHIGELLLDALQVAWLLILRANQRSLATALARSRA